MLLLWLPAAINKETSPDRRGPEASPLRQRLSYKESCRANARLRGLNESAPLSWDGGALFCVLTLVSYGKILYTSISDEISEDA